MYEKMLVPLDGSELAEKILPYVKLLGTSAASSVKLLRVIPPLPPIGLTDPAYETYKHRILTSMTDEAHEYLDKTAIGLREMGIETTSIVHKGEPAEWIVQESHDGDGTLIAMSTHGRSGISRWVLGSVTDKVLHIADNPLLIVHPLESDNLSGAVTLKRIIVPLDGSALAEEVIPHVVGLAKALDLGVVLMRVVPSREVYYQHISAFPMDGDWAANIPAFEQFVEGTISEVGDYLSKVKDDLKAQGIENVDLNIAHGSPAEAIIETAEELPNSLVAMTSHGRSGLGRWVLGSVAGRVVQGSGGPVLLVRATGDDANPI